MRRWHEHVNGNMCDGTPSDCPVTALRKARATVECGMEHRDEPMAECEFSRAELGFNRDWYQLSPRPTGHSAYASALLDGFTVQEITAAEKALARAA